jgi:hypothetical protein
MGQWGRGNWRTAKQGSRQSDNKIRKESDSKRTKEERKRKEEYWRTKKVIKQNKRRVRKCCALGH